MDFNFGALTFLLLVINGINVHGRSIRKRQIYREQVLPHKGGKIPETAFHTDRLALNRLQKEGIAIPDGVALEQRNPKVYPYAVSDLRPVLKVYHASDNRYTPSEGQYLPYGDPIGTAETTYPIPKYTDDVFTVHTAPLPSVYEPIFRKFSLPNPLLYNPHLTPQARPKYHPKFRGQLTSSPQVWTTYTQQFPDSSLLNQKSTVSYAPKLVSARWKYFKDEYFVPQYLKDFATMFNPLDNLIVR